MTNWKRVRQERQEAHERLLSELDRQEKKVEERKQEAKRRPWDGK